MQDLVSLDEDDGVPVAQVADQINDDFETAPFDVLIDILSKPLNFSDVHIERDRPIMLKMPGGWMEAKGYAPFSGKDIDLLLKQVDPNWAASINYAAISRGVDHMTSRLRINAFTVGGGVSIAVNIRRQPVRPILLADTGLPMFLRPLLDNPKGLILFTGPTGVGKTTSMASMIDHINRTRATHIITIEDPIEYVHARSRSIISQKEVKVDTPTFAQGLRDALRQAPDVIMVGEIRDKDTAETVFVGAESGHLVLASLHTNSAKGAINKMLSWFSDDAEQRARALSDSLLCIVSQTLVPTPDGTERILATEVLMNNDDVAAIIENPQSHNKLYDYMASSRDKLSHTLNSSLLQLVETNAITRGAALRYTNDRLEMHRLLEGK